MNRLAFAHTEPGSRPRVLCVDDEPLVLEGLRDILGRSFEVEVATSAPDGLEILRSEPDAFAIVISDMRMPIMGGADFLRAARAIAPDAVRLLLTGHADLQAAIVAVNGARLFRFLTKPCEPQELMRACAAALGQHRLQTAERVLLEETLRGSVDALTEVLALANPAAFGRARRVKELAGGLALVAELPDRWEIEVAAMLAHIGAVTLAVEHGGEGVHGRAAERPGGGDARARPDDHAPAAREDPAPGRASSRSSTPTRLRRPRVPAPSPRSCRSARGSCGSRRTTPSSRRGAPRAPSRSARCAAGRCMTRGCWKRSPKVIGVAPAAVLEIALAELRVGMTLADDVRSVRDELLLARGQHVTERLVERLRNLGADGVREPLRVFERQNRR